MDALEDMSYMFENSAPVVGVPALGTGMTLNDIIRSHNELKAHAVRVFSDYLEGLGFENMAGEIRRRGMPEAVYISQEIVDKGKEHDYDVVAGITAMGPLCIPTTMFTGSMILPRWEADEKVDPLAPNLTDLPVYREFYFLRHKHLWDILR